MNESQDQLKKIAGSLVENDMFLHELVENTSVFVMRLNKDGKILYYNGSNLFGYESQDVIGKSLWQMSEIETVEHYLENAAQVMESGKPVIYEDHVEWEDKEYDFQIYIYPLFDKTNYIDSVATIAFNLTEQRRIEKALHESEQRFKTVFESAKDLIFIKDKSLRYTHVSPSMRKLFQKDSSELIGKTDIDIFGSEDAKEIKKIDMRVLQGETIEREDKRPVRGKRKTFHVIKTPIFDSKGEITGLCGIARDITERNIAELKLRKSRERYQLATSAARVGVWDWDLTTNEVYIDPKIKAFLGYTDDEIPNDLDEIGKHAHSDHKEQIWKDAISYISGAATNFQTEYRMIHKDGSIRWIQVNGTTIRDKNDKPTRMIGTLTDITEPKRIEEALKISEQKYRKLYNDAPVGYHEIDIEGKIMNMNQTEAEMLGYNVEEMIGKYIWEFAAPAQKKLVRESIQQKIRNREENKSFERTYLCKDGREIHIHIEDRLVFDEDRNIVGIRSTVQDITERKKLEDELFKIRNLESLGTFAGGIAHDFNNILTGIMCNLSLARVIPSSDEDELKSVLNDTEYAAMRAKDLTQQLLTFSKGGAPVKKTVSIGELIKESATFVTSGSNVKCVFEIPDDLWQVDIDRGQMSQVVSNLVINADQSMPAGGTIRICAKNTGLEQDSPLPLDPGQYIKISVIDKGVGIPEEYLSKIFDPYFSTKQKGSGLGLSIVFSILKNHDGFITVDSTPGVGTTFEIYLPAAEKEPISDAETKSSLEKGHGKILIMDDEESVRKAARKIIRYLGYSVTTAGDGKETIELYKNEMGKGAPFDVVILDLTIPGGMGGKETVSRLLQLDPDANVIVSSGYSDDSIMANYASHGFSGVIAKPYRIHEMGDVLHKVLKQ